MQIARCFSLLFLMLFLTGCLSPTQIDETAIINIRGVDIIEEGNKRLIETTVLPYLFDPQADQSTSIMTGRGNTIKQAREEAGKQSSHLLSPGKITMELYGKEAAEFGLVPFLDTLVRDARVSDRMILAVSNQTARELLELEQESVTVNTTEFMQDLIKKETGQGKLPESQLHYFSRFAEIIGIDPILPVIDINEGKPTLVGAAAFRKDKYVLGISLEESFLINQTRKRVTGTPTEANIPVDNYRDNFRYKSEEVEKADSLNVFINVKQGRGKIKIVDEDTLTFKATIKMKAELLETYPPLEIKSRSTSNQLEQGLEEYYKKQYEKLFDKLQEVKSDAFGLGRIYTSTRKGSKTTEEEWLNKYQEATLDIEVDFTLIDYGTID